MNKKVKALLLVLCALVFAVAGVFATLAYLQDNDVVNNTVTIGDIDIMLDEGEYNGVDNITGDVDFDPDTRVQANKYHLIPGVIYDKDPIVHVREDSEASYIFISVRNDLSDIEVDTNGENTTIADQILANGWEKLVDQSTTAVSVYVYKPAALTDPYIYVPTDDEDGVVEYLDIPVFEQFKIDPTEENASMLAHKDANVIVKAAAVQVVGFNHDIDAAYDVVADHLAIN